MLRAKNILIINTMETLNHQRQRIWHQMPNVMHEHRRQYLVSGSSVKHSTQDVENKNSNFIVDWQLNQPHW